MAWVLVAGLLVLWLILSFAARRAIAIYCGIAAAWLAAEHGAGAAIGAGLAAFAFASLALDQLASRPCLLPAIASLETVCGGTLAAGVSFTLLTWNGAATGDALVTAGAVAMVAGVAVLRFRLRA